MSKTKDSNQAVIFQTSHIDKPREGKIYFREQKGLFQRIRRYLSSLLMLVFILLPWIEFNGQQAILFDVGQQQFRFFSLVLFPQDFTLFMWLFIFSAFLLFYITRLYGRIWCGYTCPQTIWMLMFNWIERRVEGTHNQSKALDKAPDSINKWAKKSIKHVLWLNLSLLTALVFMSYFIPAKSLYIDFINMQSSFLVQAWVYFFAVCTYINAGWIKDKMCLHMCPYARFQSAFFVKTTTLMTYDTARGEGRGPRKMNQAKPEGKGDCVDCNLCVQVCPVGIDIRNGLQYECINCGLCADACDGVMAKFNYAKGLISYKAEQKQALGFSFNHVYGSLACLSFVFMLTWFEFRDSSEVNVLRDRQALYRINTQGDVENTYIIKTLNKTQQVKEYQITTDKMLGIEIAGDKVFTVEPGQLQTHVIAVVDKNKNRLGNLDSPFKDIELVITDIATDERFNKAVSFYQSNDAW
ncbi:cytochrome c oxidase accessory protein CcoG [Catenovulum sp. SM1970]|uniref:cytochrome c oxidase accessory protein CcoG n=1 Tax=Marinifaba aquimaris TaxID=2741323 RepID=UPI001573DF04|nr:cytochrome c oxidase accessory protein CcoG [Marinifaba aquimaris]NTS76502.1 cytochrome c oxidase accessory protein CcoG [Marinifaba aquimaris]